MTTAEELLADPAVADLVGRPEMQAALIEMLTCPKCGKLSKAPGKLDQHLAHHAAVDAFLAEMKAWNEANPASIPRPKPVWKCKSCPAKPTFKTHRGLAMHKSRCRKKYPDNPLAYLVGK